LGGHRYAKNSSAVEHHPLQLSQADEKFVKQLKQEYSVPYTGKLVTNPRSQVSQSLTFTTSRKPEVHLYNKPSQKSAAKLR
jgi:hypothetical protein